MWRHFKFSQEVLNSMIKFHEFEWCLFPSTTLLDYFSFHFFCVATRKNFSLSCYLKFFLPPPPTSPFLHFSFLIKKVINDEKLYDYGLILSPSKSSRKRWVVSDIINLFHISLSPPTTHFVFIISKIILFYITTLL